MSYPASMDEYLASVAAGPAEGDAELDHMRRHEQALAAAPDRYLAWLHAIAEARLAKASRRDFEAFVTAVGDLPPYMAAEAMQIGLGDLAMLDELRSGGLVADQDLDQLRAGLHAAVTETVVRLLRNIAVRLGPVTQELPPVRRLVEVLEADAARSLPIDPDRPVLVVATAGRGTRLRTAVPKALVPVADVPMGLRVVAAARESGIDQFVFVLRYRAETHTGTFGAVGSLLRHPGSSEGTGHSAAFALSALRGHRSPVLLSYSDLPNLTAAAFGRALAAVQEGAVFALSTFETQDGDDSGRVSRDENGRALAVGQPRLGAALTAEGDGGLYAMRPEPTLAALGDLRNDNPRREFVLSDVFGSLGDAGLDVVTVAGPRKEFVSVNTPSQLSRVRITVLPQDARPAFAARFGCSAEGCLDAADAQVGALFNVEEPRW
ncbi:MAG TPA: NTP transferase domain-containing protein [Actinocrinis sp.]|jgi:CTP:molybdopterin cytidylyltransferase MocA